MTELYMTPPVTKSCLRFSSEQLYRVLIRKSLLYLIVDYKDFLEIRDSQVVMGPEGVPMMKNGNSIEQFLGIVGTRNSEAHMTDYRRSNYRVETNIVKI